MPLTGPIATRAQHIIPITWDALERDTRVGDAALQDHVNLAKQNTFGTVVAPNLESSFPLVAIDYAAKLAVIEIARAGVDFWMNQATNISATGTNESESYIDRASELDNLRKDLIVETRDLQMEVSKLVNFYIDSGRAVPQLSSANINPFHNTPSPEEFPRPYRQTQYS